MLPIRTSLSFFFFNDTATTEIYTLSLHDALPIYWPTVRETGTASPEIMLSSTVSLDRKSTRLNSSHLYISYAVFCLKKKKIIKTDNNEPHNTPQRAHAPDAAHGD